MSEQQNKQVADPINQNQPESPKKQTESSDPQSFSLSPKQESSSRIKSQSSPTVKRNKLEVLKKIYQKKLEQKKQKDSEKEKILQILQQKQNEEKLLNEKIKSCSASHHQEDITSNAVNQKQKEWLNKKEEARKGIQNFQLEQKNLQNLQNDICAKIHAKKEQNSQKISQKIAEKQFQLQKHLSELKGKHSHNRHSFENTQRALHQEKQQFQLISKRVQSLGASTNSQQLQSFNRKIAQKKGQEQIKQKEILQIKKIISAIENQTYHAVQNSSDQTIEILNELKKQIEELKVTAFNSKNQLVDKKKQHEEIVKNYKNIQKDVQKHKNKNHDLSQKLKKVQAEKDQIQKLPKKVKYQQKAPQQLQEKKKQQLKLLKKIQFAKAELQSQKKTYESLVPPNVIEGLKAKITKGHENSQKLQYLLKSNKQTLEENRKLDQIKQSLEWEINPDIKTSQAIKHKEEAKVKLLEEQVAQIIKKSFQVDNKLKEYTIAYPDFKPEKKQKKVQAQVIAAPVNVKVSSIKQDQKQKGAKKKKGTANNNNMAKKDSVVQQIQQKILIKQQVKKSPIKKQQQKVEVIAPQVVQKKSSADDKTNKAKKSKKNK